MVLENALIKAVKCLYKDQMVVIVLLVADVIKVCALNANLKK
jgi:hypothetical protein